MRWENEPPEFPIVPDSEISAELLEGLERLSQGARLLKIRFRWRPHLTAATGFLTKNRLLGIGADSLLEIARAVASFAKHLFEQGGCESRFEAQVHREFEQRAENGRAEREWRSVTFYVDDPNRPTAKVATNMEPSFDDDGEEDELEGDEDDEPAVAPRRPTVRMRRPDFGQRRHDEHADYAGFVELSRTDPTAFAMLVMEKSYDKSTALLERLLDAAVNRLDRVRDSEVSSTRHINEALQTLTKGASDIAGLGLSLFQSGLEGQARVARMEHESELGKERTELMRDAVKQGSLLIQAVLMSNAAKRRQAPEPQPATRVEQRPTAPPPRAAPTAPPATEPANDPGGDADRDIMARTNRLLELLTDDELERARLVAPSVVSVFERLRGGPRTAAHVRQVIREAEQTVDRSELASVSDMFEAEIVTTFGGLLMRVLSEGM